MRRFWVLVLALSLAGCGKSVAELQSQRGELVKMQIELAREILVLEIEPSEVPHERWEVVDAQQHKIAIVNGGYRDVALDVRREKFAQIAERLKEIEADLAELAMQ